MIIPIEQLSAEAIQGLVEEFITREGTDYGVVEIPLTEKVAQVKQQLAGGEVVVVYDQTTESVSLQTRRDAEAFERQLASAGLSDPDSRLQEYAREYYQEHDQVSSGQWQSEGWPGDD